MMPAMGGGQLGVFDRLAIVSAIDGQAAAADRDLRGGHVEHGNRVERHAGGRGDAATSCRERRGAD